MKQNLGKVMSCMERVKTLAAVTEDSVFEIVPRQDNMESINKAQNLVFMLVDAIRELEEMIEELALDRLDRNISLEAKENRKYIDNCIDQN